MIEPLEDLNHDEVWVEYEGTWWSTSALKTIQACGKQYKYRYVEKAKTKATPYLAFGRAVHKVIESVHKESNFTDSFWQREWERVWFEQSSKVDWKGFKKGTFSTMGIKMLGQYVDDNQGAIVIGSEIKFPRRDEQYAVGPFKVRGVIDQIRRIDGRPVVLDFKTSGKEPDPLILRADPQWTFYWDYARKRLKEEPLLGLYHLKTGKIMYTEREESDLEILRESLEDAQKRVDQKMFSRSIGFQCVFCDFKDQCLGGLGKEKNE